MEKKENKTESLVLSTKTKRKITINYTFFLGRPVKAEIELPVTAFYKKYSSKEEAEKAINKALRGLISVITDYWYSNAF